MPKETPIMRAPTKKERVGDFLRGAYETVAEQPLGRIADLLGMSDFEGMAKTFTTPDDGVRMGMMPGGPGKGLAAIGRSRGVSTGESAAQMAKRVMTDENPGYLSMKSRGDSYGPLPPRYQGPAEAPTAAAKSHPALPAEFNMEVRNPSRTAPIDMNNPPPGKMEYLDPDVAEFMTPGKIDVTTKEGQRRLRLLLGK